MKGHHKVGQVDLEPMTGMEAIAGAVAFLNTVVGKQKHRRPTQEVVRGLALLHMAQKSLGVYIARLEKKLQRQGIILVMVDGDLQPSEPDDEPPGGADLIVPTDGTLH